MRPRSLLNKVFEGEAWASPIPSKTDNSKVEKPKIDPYQKNKLVNQFFKSRFGINLQLPTSTKEKTA